MYKIVYSLKVMRRLVERGFIPSNSMPNPKNPQYTCWIFEDTEAFRDAFNKIQGENKDE